MPDGYDKSITELEYRKAVDAGKKCLIFLLHEEASWPLKFIDKGEDASKITALREEICKKHLVGFFKSPDELASLVSVAVHKWESESPQLSSDILSSETNKWVNEVASKEHDSEIIEWKAKSERYINELKESYKGCRPLILDFVR